MKALMSSQITMACLAAVGLSTIVLFLWMLPSWYLNRQCKAAEKEILPDQERLDLEIKLRDFLLKAAGGILALASVWIGWYQFNERQAAEQYSKALELIAGERSEQRSSGLYILGLLAEQHPREYHWRMIDNVCSFLRQHATKCDAETEKAIHEYLTQLDWYTEECNKLPPRPSEDIQTAISILGRRNIVSDKYYISSYWQQNINSPFKDNWLLFDMSQCHFIGADISRMNLRDVNLTYSDLRGGNLFHTNLDEASLYAADLSGVWAVAVSMKGASLDFANLENAFLVHADLEQAQVCEANFKNAILTNAHLERVQGLTWEQLEMAYGFKEARLPIYLLETTDGYARALGGGADLSGIPEPSE